MRLDRPSRAEYLSAGFFPSAPIIAIDKDLSREAWGEGYRAIVTPLTAPLLARAVDTECRERQYAPEQTRRLVERITQDYSGARSCFYVMLSAPSSISDGSRLHDFRTEYGTDGKKWLQASLLSEEERKVPSFRVLHQLLFKQLPSSYRNPVRNTLGFGSHALAILCGQPIDFHKQFFFRLVPSFGKTPEAKQMGWSPAVAE